MRKIAWLALLVWSLAAFATPALATATIPAIELVPGQSAGEIKADIRFTRAGHEGPPLARDFASARAVSHTSTQFGTVGQPAYVFLRLHNTGAEPGSWMLTTGRSTISEFTLYRQDADRWRVILDGADREQLGKVLDQFQAYATEVDLAGGEEATYVIRFRDEVSSWMPLRIETAGDFFVARRGNIALVAGVVAGSLILALFNVVLLAATGRRVFIWLGLAEAAFAFNTLHAEGYLTIFWLYRHPDLQGVVGDIARSAFGLLMLQFGREFLATRTGMPRYDVFLRATMAFGVLVVLAAFVRLAVPALPVMPLHAAAWMFTLVASSALPVIGWVATRRHGMEFLPLLIGWSALSLYIITTAIAITGLVPFLAVNWHWIGPIGLFECAMATLAVGLHLRKLQHDRLAAEQEAKRELLARMAISEDASRLAEERETALAGLKARDRLIEMSAHDTRHVLHALSSAVFLARQAGSELPPRDLMTLIEASARHLEEIVGSSVTRDSGGGSFLALGLVDVARLLEDLVTIYAAAAMSSNVVLTRACVPNTRIIADEALLVRVLSNLLNNAVRATQSGVIEISCESSSDCLAITVKDSGPGMPKEIADFLSGDSEGHDTGPMPSRFGKGWRAIRETVSLLRAAYTIETGAGGTRVTILLPLPVEDEQPISLEQLQKEFPRACFIDEETASHEELQDRLMSMRPDRVPILVVSRATSDNRIKAAAMGHLLLLRPLVRSMMEHPYVAEMTSPAARARSTS
nr:ATP-binding protein [Erythrobacter sp.]